MRFSVKQWGLQMRPFFFFGSLRDRSLLEVVLDREIAENDLTAATAPGYVTLRLKHEPYPYLTARPGQSAEGVVVFNLTDTDQRRLEYFEEAEYGLAPITVETARGTVDAQFFATDTKLEPNIGDTQWDFSEWCGNARATAIEEAIELMAHIDLVPVEDCDTIWPGIKTRAMMRARAKATKPICGQLRGTHAAEDVESVRVARPYTNFFAVEEHRLRHRRFDGSMSPEITRAALTSGDAVTVVPFDPRTGRVLLIEQFRAPMFARGDACPWSIEAVAGRIDQEPDPEACARREAMEEAGLDLGRMEQIAAYYSSPGIIAEHITSFVGEARLESAGGLYGAANENEDIRAFTCPLDEALDAVASGEIDNAPAILSLLWLSRNRRRLAAEWV